MQKRRKLETRIGETYGQLKILAVKRDENYMGFAFVRCVCGNEKWMDAQGIFSGKSTACGCTKRKRLVERNRSHGMSHTKIYRIWAAMLTRVRNPRQRSAVNYCLRGIGVCKRWLSFENFYLDMGKDYMAPLTIERINVNKGYEPSNCRWAMPYEQYLNRTDSRILTVNGISRPLCVWALKSGVNRKTIDIRIRRGWKVKEAIFTPPRKFSWRRKR